VVFCVLAYYLSSQLRGNQPRLNQIDIVDIDTETSFTRGTTWANLYCARSQVVDVSLPVEGQGRGGDAGDQLLGWSGLPGSGFGGMNTRSRAGLFQTPYTIRMRHVPDKNTPDKNTLHSQLEGMPVPVASSKCLEGRWLGASEQLEPAQLTFDSFRLHGAVTNPLPLSLDNCRIYYRNTVYVVPGKWTSGQQRHLDDYQPQTLERYLTGRRVELDQTASGSVPWDVTSTEIPRILEMMMFYEAAGGPRYTRLTHRYLDFIDMTHLIQHRQALLVGRASQGSGDLKFQPTLNPVQQRWTYYRLTLPVVQQDEARKR
jgi:hypothetical protein